MLHRENIVDFKAEQINQACLQNKEDCFSYKKNCTNEINNQYRNSIKHNFM